MSSYSNNKQIQWAKNIYIIKEYYHFSFTKKLIAPLISVMLSAVYDEWFSYLQVHLNKLECLGKVNLFKYFNSNCETRVLNKFNAHRLKYFKSLVLLIVMILAHI